MSDSNKPQEPLRHPAITEDIPAKAKIYYVAIVAIIAAAILVFFVYRSIIGSVDNRQAPVQQNSNLTNPNTTEKTGAPAQNSDTPDDRTEPDPAGSGGNTLLNPEQ